MHRPPQALCFPPRKPAGRIELVLGPMFAGKSTELIRRLRRHRVARLRCYAIRPVLDDRDPPQVISAHDGVTTESCDGVYATLGAFIGTRFLEGWDVVCIDEGQLFPDLVAGCVAMADSGCVVIVAALDRTSEGTPFGDTMYLTLEAERVDKLRAVCVVCQSDYAIFSVLRDGVHKHAGDNVLIGGSELYYAACRACRPAPPPAESPREATPRWNIGPVTMGAPEDDGDTGPPPGFGAAGSSDEDARMDHESTTVTHVVPDSPRGGGGEDTGELVPYYDY